MENNFKEYFEQSADAFILIKDNKIIDCNNASIRLLGYDEKSELINFHPADFSPIYQPGQRLSVTEADRYIQKAKQNKAHRFEWVHLKKDKTEIVVEVILTYIKIDEEEFLHAAWRDITENKAKEVALQKSNELHNKLMSTFPDLIVVVDLSGNINYVNNSVEKISRYTQEELLGKNMLELIHPDDITRALENTMKMMHAQLGPIDYRFIDKDKKIVFLEMNGEVLRDADSNPYGMVYICRDIREKKKAEQELRESEQRFKVLQEAAFSSIIIHSNGIILEASQSFCDLSGYNYNEIIGLDGKNLFAKEFQNSISIGVQGFLSAPYVTRLFRKTGIEIDVEILSRQLPYKGKIAQVAEIRSISERIINETKLQEYTVKLEEANKTKDKLFSIIAHDLRSPFQGLLGYSDLLTGNISEFSFQDLSTIVNSINTSLKSLYHLIENLLYWARMQTEGFSFNPIRINLYDQCVKVIDNLSIVKANKNISIENKISQDEIIFADENMINSILHNLISNAVKFSKNNSKIIVECMKSKNFVFISVIDFGIGISKNNINKLFKIGQDFTMLGTANEKGTGLGLLLCKEMIELHGGTIEVESEVNKGSKFTFSIPLIQI